MSVVNIGGLERAVVAAALYNAARPAGMGFLSYQKGSISIEEARDWLADGRRVCGEDHLDYVHGRYLKVIFEGDELDVTMYDSVNGEGTAEKAIAALRLAGTPANEITQSLHREGKEAAARDVENELAKPMPISSGTVEVFGVPYQTIELSLHHEADELRRAIEKAQDEAE